MILFDKNSTFSITPNELKNLKEMTHHNFCSMLTTLIEPSPDTSTVQSVSLQTVGTPAAEEDDDDTTATFNEDFSNNQPEIVHLPGIFVQDEIKINDLNTLLVGIRYDYNSTHGSIFTPRLNFKKTNNKKLSTLRLSFGSGYRVAQIFTEDHAALTGARDVVFLNKLSPEKSWNFNLNYVRKIYSKQDYILNFDGFYKSLYIHTFKHPIRDLLFL